LLDLNEVIESAEKMLRRVLGEDVAVSTDLERAPGQVHMDPGQIEQVVMNLAVNARDAMPAGGQLRIETRHVELDSARAQSLDVRPGKYIVLSVSDTGIGMDEAVKARLFEPFFTTKERGKGTGLGLPTVFGIARQCQGGIEVASEPGRGSTFRVYFPLASKPSSAVADEQARPASSRNTETVLIVEDEEQVRTVARDILQRQGYKVLVARSPESALSLCMSETQRVDLLLTDVVMPRLSGPELAERLAVLRPQIKVLFMSGFMDDALSRHGATGQKLNLISKPLTPQTLSQKVRELLGTAGQ
jgi:CheY-like chemotaxis protein